MLRAPGHLERFISAQGGDLQDCAHYREHPSVLLFAVDRGPRGTGHVVWERRDRFSGEDAPAIKVSWPTEWTAAVGVDALGESPTVTVANGRPTVHVGAPPIYLAQQDLWVVAPGAPAPGVERTATRGEIEEDSG